MQLTAAIVGPAHGLRGEVILDVRSDDPEVLTPGARLDVAGRGTAVTVRSIRVHKDRVLASFEEYVSREDAEALRGARLLVEEHEEEDAWYPKDLVGLEARLAEGNGLGLPAGQVIGKVVDVLDSAQTLLKIRLVSPVRDAVTGEVTESTALVPFVDELVPDIDLEEGYLTIDPPGGLIPGL